MNFNPFSHLVRTRKYSTSYLIGASFWERVKDTFRVFYGDLYEDDLGILDYVFPLPRMINAAFTPSVSQSGNGSPREVSMAGQIIIFSFSAVKFLAASVLTLAVAPFIGLAHLFLSAKARQSERKMRDLQVREVINPHCPNNCPEFLEKRRLGSFSSDAYVARVLSVHKFCESELLYQRWSNNPSEGMVFGLYPPFYPPRDPSNTLVGVIDINPENSTGIRAMLESNVFVSTESVEEQSKDSNLFDLIESRISSPSLRN